MRYPFKYEVGRTVQRVLKTMGDHAVGAKCKVTRVSDLVTHVTVWPYDGSDPIVFIVKVRERL
jgi:hypothetical protein